MQTYPVILKPTTSALSVLPSKNQTKRRHKVGPSELVALCKIDKLVGEEIMSSVPVKIEGHNYEPDMVYVNKDKGICIDIEVDEPYSAGGRPTHYLLPDGTNKDSERNKHFVNAGWYVVRFSEEQMYTQTASCVKEIYKLLLEIGAISKMPQKLADAHDLSHQQRWTENDSCHMKRGKYRTNYLKYDPSNFGLVGYIECTKLIIPIAIRSITSKRLRNEMIEQLKGFFFGR